MRKAASKAAIDVAVKELVSAKNRLQSSKPKARFNLYDVALQSLQANGVQIKKAALQKKVSRSINGQIGSSEILLSANSPSSTVSSLSSPSGTNNQPTNMPSPTEANSNPQHPGSGRVNLKARKFRMAFCRKSLIKKQRSLA
jgi:hypothetical protein